MQLIFFTGYVSYDYTLKNAKVIFAQKLSYNLLAPSPRYALAVNAARPISNAMISPDK